ncbi:hypothetical protein B0H14DRAFT_3164134 [Mycena olivaceomarginata]|nr:hypothetical protein B0H14DRAFT_3164134 [Mycena olivaceomarginata]
MPELPESVTSGTLPRLSKPIPPKQNLLLTLLVLGHLLGMFILWSLPRRLLVAPLMPKTHPRNVILKFKDNSGRTYWCQIRLLKHTVSQIYNKVDWENAICLVDSSSRGFKIGVAFEFKHHFYWSESRALLPAQQPDVFLEFPRFLDDLVAWMKQRRTVQSCRAGNAMTLVRTSTEIFPGAGVYTISELWHMAGLSPNLTEAEVFDSASRTARLCAAFFHFGKEAHTTLWTLVKRFLVDYVICVRPNHRLLYSDRLHVYGKDRSYVTTRFNKLLTDFEVFVPLEQNEELNLGSLIFGAELWGDLRSVPTNMSATWLNPSSYLYLFSMGAKARRASHPLVHLYRASNTDIWSVIPAYPNNSAPIPRPKPRRSMSNKVPLAPTPSPTPMSECDSGTREKALLNSIIQYTQDFTVGPLDYCGIARLIKGRGPDIIMYCKGDPRVPEFYHRRLALAEVTAKLRLRGKGKKGLAAKVVAGVNKKIARIPKLEVGEDGNKENEKKPQGKRRHSADRDLALSGLILSPRKKRRLSSSPVPSHASESCFPAASTPKIPEVLTMLLENLVVA